MPGKVSVTIDGREIRVPEGTNLVEAAEEAGVHIPNLCYLKGMKPIGACRLCLVEVEGGKAPVIACNTRVKDGMKVITTSDRVLEARKFVIDLIVSMHPLDCMTCTKAGVCDLQRYAYDFEIKESSFTRKKFGYPVDEANPFIKRDPDYCILCGRCVRVCKEQGTSVLDFMGRGVGAKVVTADDKPLQESTCTFCGSCVDACPVNSILEADRWRKGREWEYSHVDSTCLLCGNGCSITVSTRDGMVVKVNSSVPEGSAERYLCAYGRFGFDSMVSDLRVSAPMKKEGTSLVETTWEDALKIAGEKLKAAKANAGFIGTGGMLNEEAIALKNLAHAMKSDNLDTTVGTYADVNSLVASQTADLDAADVILAVGLNTSQWERVLPALDAVLRKRKDRNARLIVINSKETGLSSEAAIDLRGDEAETLKSLAKALIGKGLKADKKLEAASEGAQVGEDVEKAAAAIIESKSPVILASPSLFDAASNIAQLKGSAVCVPFEANAKGVALMGVKGKGKTYKEMSKGGMDVLYVVGTPAINKRPDVKFLICQTPYMTDLATQADLVLPSAAYLEQNGTIVDYLGRLKDVSMAVEPYGDSKSGVDVLVAVGKAAGSAAVKKPTATEVKKPLKAKSRLSPKAFEKKPGLDISGGEFTESANAPVIRSSRLLWLKETEKAAV